MKNPYTGLELPPMYVRFGELPMGSTFQWVTIKPEEPNIGEVQVIPGTYRKSTHYVITDLSTGKTKHAAPTYADLNNRIVRWK